MVLHSLQYLYLSISAVLLRQDTLTRVHVGDDLSPFGWCAVLTNLSQVIDRFASQEYLHYNEIQSTCIMTEINSNNKIVNANKIYQQEFTNQHLVVK